jgi:ribosome-binding protein aMBF1 (putative translation factor)
MSKHVSAIDYRSLELDGIRYVILRESLFSALCQRAGIERPSKPEDDGQSPDGLGMDRASLAEKLARRRRAAGLSQAVLARRAGVRPETLNRIERGRTTPDFATIRKLVIAMNAAEQEHSALPERQQSQKETHNVDEEPTCV